MLCRPKPWQWQETSYNGGYYLANRALLRNGVTDTPSDLTRPISAETLRGLNTIQDVPPGGSTPRSWRRCGPPGLTDFRSPTCPAPTTSRLLPASLTRYGKVGPRKSAAPTRRPVADVHGRNARAEGRRFSWLSRLDMATDVADEPAIWFPHFCDFRGRAYPMVADLSPQGDDASKALLMFARGKPLGQGRALLALRQGGELLGPGARQGVAGRARRVGHAE
jgi:hypothetical protein